MASHLLTTRGELAATLRLAGPLALANLLQMAIAATDVVFVARLGEAELAASSLAIAVYALLLWVMSGLTGTVAALISAELGSRRHAVREVRRSVRMALWLGIACGLAMLALVPLAGPLMDLTGQDPAVAPRAARFLAILVFAMVPMLVANVLRNFVSALGRPFLATAITALMIGVNAAGNSILIYGRFGAPALGLEGSAVATVITGCCFALAYIVVIRADRRLRRYAIWGYFFRPHWDRLASLLRIGLPVAVTILAEGGIFSAAAFLMGALGALPLAAHTLALQIAAVAFQVPFGIGQAATIRVGWFLGAGQPQAAGRAGWTAIGIGTAFMGMTAMLMLFAPRLLLSAYINAGDPANAALVALASSFMVVAAVFQLADGVQAVAMGALRGLQDTRVPMAFAIFGYWVPGMACCLSLGFFTPLAGVGIWIGLALGLFVVAALMLHRWAGRERLGLTS
ncbi:MAG: hypothetical protein RLZZ08_1774 [Pseudomonadota bacterium]|jgi:MATE family multidrug resistance protein